ncbi:nuclear transport factor 2 family protein [Yinghuangia sp. ASG 101]|uniref:nuclear transport factor 2 family protein n=1 Tax=Yinghuangia sp. ASG 101 TaxID=2896848 RepID=UPI001E6426B5|nr:nuclear transport factor 2 family protein [Yinghuangia sp. ASG 101]UGQ13622.1 nuclear transport factor 2 family protein [Yinghuangia sp. ASG 101]
MTATTTDYAAAVERYLAVWNEPDPVRRRALAEAAFTEDAAYTDPLADVAGRDAVDMVVGAVRNEFPGLTFTLAGPVDGHHNLVRFTWHLGPEGGEALAIGFDVAVLAEDGRIRTVHGFLDKVPTGS